MMKYILIDFSKKQWMNAVIEIAISNERLTDGLLVKFEKKKERIEALMFEDEIDTEKSQEGGKKR